MVDFRWLMFLSGDNLLTDYGYELLKIGLANRHSMSLVSDSIPDRSSRKDTLVRLQPV
jgi:hypothetical protein